MFLTNQRNIAFELNKSSVTNLKSNVNIACNVWHITKNLTE